MKSKLSHSLKSGLSKNFVYSSETISWRIIFLFTSIVLILFFSYFHSVNNFLFLFYSSLFIAVLFYFGIGLTILFCPKALKKYTLFLSPVIGYCFLTLLGWYFYIYNKSGGTDTYAIFLTIPPFFFLIAAGLALKKQRENLNSYFEINLLVPLFIGVIFFLIQSIPFLSLEDSLTSISLHNNDIADSATISTYLKEYKKDSNAGFLGQFDPADVVFLGKLHILEWLTSNAIFGGSFFVAFACSLFSLESYQLQSLGLHIFFLFGIPIVYALARESFEYSHLGSSIISLLYALNSIIWNIIYEGYQGQIIATTLALAVFLLHFQSIRHCKKLSDFYSYIPIAVFLNWGISLTYPHMFPFIFAPIITYLFFLAFFNKSWGLARQWIYFFLIVLFLTAILSPHRAKSVINYLLWSAESSSGSFVPWITPYMLFGLPEAYSGDLIVFVLSVIFAGVIITGFAKTYKHNKNVFLLSTSSIAVILFGYLLLCYMDQKNGEWGGYKSFKLLSFFLPLILPASLILLRNIQFTFRNSAALLFSLFLLGANISSATNVMGHVLSNYKFVDKDIFNLKKVQDFPRIDSINLLGPEIWDVLWQVNFLISKKLYFAIDTYAGRRITSLDGEWDLLKKQPGILHIKEFDKKETLILNSTYVLKKAGEPKTLKGNLRSGWQRSPESTISIEHNSASIQLHSPTDKFLIDFQTKFIVPSSRCRLSVNLNSKEVGLCQGNQPCLLSQISLSKGINILSLEAAPSPEFLTTNIRECFGYQFIHIEISPSKGG